MSEPGNRPIRVIGLGCQRGCPAWALLGLVEACLHEHALTVSDITALASIDSKSDEAGLLALGKQLQLPIGFFSADELAVFEPHLSHRSQVAFDHTGCYGIAESSALAMASRLSGSPVKLVIERRNSSRATFALAEYNPL
jgi:cobalt-precorrin 5A hydrolase